MLMAWLGIAVAGMFQLLNDALASVLPDDAWSGMIAISQPLAFLVPPTFAATVPLALTAMLAVGSVRFLIGIISSKAGV